MEAPPFGQEWHGINPFAGSKWGQPFKETRESYNVAVRNQREKLENIKREVARFPPELVSVFKETLEHVLSVATDPAKIMSFEHAMKAHDATWAEAEDGEILNEMCQAIGRCYGQIMSYYGWSKRQYMYRDRVTRMVLEKAEADRQEKTKFASLGKFLMNTYSPEERAKLTDGNPHAQLYLMPASLVPAPVPVPPATLPAPAPPVAIEDMSMG